MLLLLGNFVLRMRFKTRVGYTFHAFVSFQKECYCMCIPEEKKEKQVNQTIQFKGASFKGIMCAIAGVYCT